MRLHRLFSFLIGLTIKNRETAAPSRVVKPIRRCSVTRANVECGKGSRRIKILDMHVCLCFVSATPIYNNGASRGFHPLGTYGHKKSPTMFVEHLTVARYVTCLTRQIDLTLQI